MLTFNLLKNHAGILLIGDFITLETFYDVINQVNDQSGILDDQEETFLGLAYDVRKAFSGERQIIKCSREVGIRYGVEILWPVLLVQARMLRVALGFFDNTKCQQALTFALESVIEDALREDFAENASTIIELWNRIDPSHPEPEKRLDSRGAQYSLWTKKERYDKIIGLLVSFDPMYDLIYAQSISQDETVTNLKYRYLSSKYLVSSEDYRALDNTEWVDPNW